MEELKASKAEGDSVRAEQSRAAGECRRKPTNGWKCRQWKKNKKHER